MDGPIPMWNRNYPERIVCLSDETTETLFLLGEDSRIAGVSGFTTRPREAREKPRVSTFNSANFEMILELKPDLVLAFSDVQAEITRELILRGLAVITFNQRTIQGIFEMILALSRIVGRQERGTELANTLHVGLLDLAKAASGFTFKPRVFFEEWNDPLISAVGWVEELIEMVGGVNILPEMRNQPKSKDRRVSAAEVVSRNPDVIIASWCGMKVDVEEIRSRPNWSGINAVRCGHIYVMNSSEILQPGPAALTDGARQLHRILAGVAAP